MNASIATSRRWSRVGIAFVLPCAVASCATTQPNVEDARRLAEVTAIAGQSVPSFHYMSMSSFEPIGQSDLLVFTSPRSAWLLHLDGTCRNIDFDPFLNLTSTFGRVSSGFDSVIARDNPIPCRIQQIRPVDAALLRRVDRERKAQGVPTDAKPDKAPAGSSAQPASGSGGT